MIALPDWVWGFIIGGVFGFAAWIAPLLMAGFVGEKYRQLGKLGTTEFRDGFGKLIAGDGSLRDVEFVTAWLSRVTDANRCGLGAGQRAVASGILDTFVGDVVACLEGACPGHRGLSLDGMAVPVVQIPA